jgi:hypothetical protein
MTTPLIELREVNRRYGGGQPALEEVSLASEASEASEAVAVLAPSGERRPRYRAGRLRAGLSTAIRSVADGPLGTPRVALALSGAGFALLMLVGASAPNVNTLLIRLPLSVLPSQPAWITYPVMITALLLECAGTAGMLLARSRGWSPSARRLYAAGAMFVAVLVNLTPAGSSDTASYAAYGRLAALGHDPYTTTPASALQHTAYYPLIGTSWQHTPSVYGPAATWIQAAAAAIGGSRPWVTIWMLLIFNGAVFLAVGWLLLRTSDDPVRATLLWTANPLLLQQLVAGGHLDTLIAGATVCALLLTRRSGSLLRDATAGAMLGAAAGVKIDAGFIAIGVAWPLLRERQWRRLAIMTLPALAVMIGVYAPDGLHALTPLSSASKFVATASIWTLPWLAGRALIGPSAMSAVISALWPITLAGLAWYLGRRVSVGRTAAVCVTVLMVAWIIAAPWAMPWYTAPGWAALARLPRNPLTRWLVALTAVLAIVHSSGGHPW